MDLQTCLKKMELVGVLAFATVDSEGAPQIRNISAIHYESDALYFFTARGKNFCKELMEDGRIQILAYTKYKEMIRLSGKAYAVAENEQRKWMDIIFEEQPYLANVYPGDTREIGIIFCIDKAEVEYFNLGVNPIFRETYILGNVSIKEKGYYISPLCGRNFEYFSEDPYLAGKMAAAYIRGIQSQGAAACPKHFAVNSQETRRMVMNSVIDERTLREIYLTAFEIAVKEGKAKAIMSSYNQINGVYANESTHLLREILRDEWGFDGIVITDWGGSNDHVEGVKAGSDLEMPAAGFDSPHALVEAVQKGVLKEEAIDECVDRILELALTLPQNNESNKSKEVDLKAHHQLAKKAAEQSTVLLKNEEAILPLKAGTKVALIGEFAFDPRYQGAGSSLVNPTQVDNMVELISEYDLELAGYVRGYVRHGKEDEELENAAVNLAKHADVILYSFGLDEMSESEGVDRTHMRIKKNQIALLEKLVKVNTNIIGIIGAGAPIEMPWEKHLKGILHGYLCGQAGAGAILDIIVGKVNPSGKICETYPVKYEDTPAYHYFPAKEKTSE